MTITEIKEFEREYFAAQNMTSREHQMYVCILWLLESHQDLTRALACTQDELGVVRAGLAEVEDYAHRKHITALKTLLEKTNA
jgi:hypothetical protein